MSRRMAWADGHTSYPSKAFRRVFRPVKRTLPPGAGIVTAYTDGAVTLRSNRDKIGYHEAQDLSTYLGVRVGDFVVHGLDILRGSVGVSDSDGAISPVCTVCVPTSDDVDPRYMAYVMRQQAASGLTRAMARGVREGGADFRRWETLADLPLLCPPHDVQRRVADFLDDQCTRIDSIVALRDQQIVALRTRTERAVAQELIPASATSVALRRLGTQVTTGPFGTVFAAAEYESGGVPMINPSHIKDGQLRPDPHHAVSPGTAARLARHRLRCGDLVTSRKGDLGRTALVQSSEDGWICGSDSIAIHVDRSRLLPEFLHALLWLPEVREQLLVASVGATMPSLNESNLRSLTVPLVPLDAQRRAVERTTALRETLVSIEQEMQAQMDLLRERRQSLITAAVTGEFDVTTAGGRGVGVA